MKYVEKFISFAPFIFFLIFMIDIVMSFVSNNFNEWLRFSISAIIVYLFYIDSRVSNIKATQNVTVNQNMDAEKFAQELNKAISKALNNKLGNM